MDNLPTRSDYWQRTTSTRRFSRRAVIRGSAVGAIGLAGAALIGCSTKDGGGSSTPPPAGGTGAAAASATSAAKVKTGGQLTTTDVLDPVSLVGLGLGGGTDHQFFWTISDNLVAYNQKGLLDASISLAEKWEIVEGNKLNFTLRQGVKFHDGTPFNAEAVKYNLSYILDAKTLSTARPDIASITKVEAPADNRVTLTLKAPNAALLTGLGDRGGVVVSPASVEKYGKEVGRHPVGTGPFVFKEWMTGDHITVTKNPDYWGKDEAGTRFPYLDAIRWNIVPDATIASANLESGTVDLLTVLARDIDRLEKTGKYNVATFNGISTRGLNFNQALAPLDDIRVRRAIAHAQDKAAIIQAVTAGKAPLGLGPLPPSSWAYNDKIKPLNFDLDAAKKELAASKHPNGLKLDGILSNRPENLQLAELQKSMLKKINIDLNIIPAPIAEYQDRFLVKKNVHMDPTFTYSLRVDPNGMIAQLLHSSALRNPGHVANSELDGLIEKAAQTYEVKERKDLYDRVQQMGIDQVYQSYNFYASSYGVASKKVNNLGTLWGGEGKQRYKSLWLS